MVNRGLAYLYVKASSAYPELKVTISEYNKFSMFIYGSLNNNPCIGSITYQSNNISGYGFLIWLSNTSTEQKILQVSGIDTTHFIVSGFESYGRYIFISTNGFTLV